MFYSDAFHTAMISLLFPPYHFIITDAKMTLTALDLFLQFLYPLLILGELLSVSPGEVGQLLPLGVLQSCQFVLVFVHLTTHLLSQLLFQSSSNIRVLFSTRELIEYKTFIYLYIRNNLQP